MARYHYRGYRRRHYRRQRSSSFKSVVRTGGRAARFGGRAASRVGMGVLKFGTKAASHVIVAGVSTVGKVIRSLSRG